MRPVISWQVQGGNLTATVNGHTESIEAPITGLYTNAREWRRLLGVAVRILETRLEMHEIARRL